MHPHTLFVDLAARIRYSEFLKVAKMLRYLLRLAGKQMALI
jgi:hypothetical protein